MLSTLMAELISQIFYVWSKRKHGTGPHQYLWEKPMDLEGARDAAATGDFELDFKGDWTWSDVALGEGEIGRWSRVEVGVEQSATIH